MDLFQNLRRIKETPSNLHLDMLGFLSYIYFYRIVLIFCYLKKALIFHHFNLLGSIMIFFVSSTRFQSHRFAINSTLTMCICMAEPFILKFVIFSLVPVIILKIKVKLSIASLGIFRSYYIYNFIFYRFFKFLGDSIVSV